MIKTSEIREKVVQAMAHKIERLERKECVYKKIMESHTIKDLIEELSDECD